LIDEEGYRPNVGIILMNPKGEVFWAKRRGQDAWQFPQGGIQAGETPVAALYRELQEEVGLLPEHVQILSETSDWLRYRLPDRYLRSGSDNRFVGQKQKWFLLLGEQVAAHVKLDTTYSPEFDDWRWVPYDYPADHVIDFKQAVYRQALTDLAPARTQYLSQFGDQNTP
jgi:putative (di)nucleoside polyphosphate hydrolase